MYPFNVITYSGAEPFPEYGQRYLIKYKETVEEIVKRRPSSCVADLRLLRGACKADSALFPRTLFEPI